MAERAGLPIVLGSGSLSFSLLKDSLLFVAAAVFTLGIRLLGHLSEGRGTILTVSADTSRRSPSYRECFSARMGGVNRHFELEVRFCGFYADETALEIENRHHILIATIGFVDPLSVASRILLLKQELGIPEGSISESTINKIRGMARIYMGCTH